jgi:hypothetical protein
MKKMILASLAFLAVSPAFAGTVFECVGTGLTSTLIELTADKGAVPVAQLGNKLVSVSYTSDNQLKIIVKTSDKSGAAVTTSANGDFTVQPVLYQEGLDFFFVCGVKK